MATGDAPGFLDKQGNRSFNWVNGQKINRRIAKLGPTLVKLTSTGVYNTDPLPIGTIPLLPEAPVKKIEGGSMVVGCFKDAAGKAADQAKHATAVGKEKLEDRNLQKKISDLCQEIGALVVSQKRDEAPEDAAAQIDAKVAEIAEIEKQMEANNLAGEAGEAAAGS